MPVVCPSLHVQYLVRNRMFGSDVGCEKAGFAVSKDETRVFDHVMRYGWLPVSQGVISRKSEQSSVIAWMTDDNSLRGVVRRRCESGETVHGVWLKLGKMAAPVTELNNT